MNNFDSQKKDMVGVLVLINRIAVGILLCCLLLLLSRLM